MLLAPCALQILIARVKEGHGIPASLRARALVWAIVPILIWTVFSLLYYGFPFPNTAYAKLGTGISHGVLWKQGLYYFGNTLDNDPLTLAVAALALLFAPFVRRWGWCWALGVALYLVYVVNIGGDFMAGRFFTAPMLAGAIVLARARLPRSRAPLVLVLLTLAVPALAWHNIKDTVHTAITGRLSGVGNIMDAHGIADERSWYFQNRALSTLPAPNLALLSPDGYRKRNRDQPIHLTCGGLGYFSIWGGAYLRSIDTCALADPLLAHLPVSSPSVRIGHFERAVPAGYVESIERNANLLTDPALHRCYESIRRITRGPLLDAQRLRDIVYVNLHRACARTGATP